MTKLLIIKLGSLGDVLRTTCILPGLHQTYPDVHISWLTSPAALILLVHNSLINEVLNVREISNFRGLSKTYDVVINLDDDKLACRITSLLSTKILIGAYEDSETRCYTDNSAKWFDMSLISRYGKEKADQLKRQNNQTYPSILCDILGITSGRPTLSISHRERTFAQKFSKRNLTSHRPIVGLNTGAGSRWRFKKLSEKKTARLADLLIESLNVSVILFGGPNEKDRNKTIHNLSTNCLIDAGNDNTLLEFSSLIKVCDLLITSDSLALHIASCFEMPVIVFFGPTSSNEIELFSRGAKIVPNMDCLCCYRKDCDIRPTCMDNISIEEVRKAAEHLLST